MKAHDFDGYVLRFESGQVAVVCEPSRWQIWRRVARWLERKLGWTYWGQADVRCADGSKLRLWAKVTASGKIDWSALEKLEDQK